MHQSEHNHFMRRGTDRQTDGHGEIKQKHLPPPQKKRNFCDWYNKPLVHFY